MQTNATLFLIAMLGSFLLTYPIRAIALRFGVVDQPEKRKMHQIPIPLLGGITIGLSFGVVTMLAAGWGLIEPAELKSYAGLMLGSAIILLLGLVDDVVGVKPRTKLAGQVLAALVVVAMGARIDAFTNPLGESFRIGWLGVPLTVLWLVGVTNAMNLIDGLDGLAVGIGGIAALGLFAVAATANPFVALITVVLAGASFGFLPHNFYPAKVFLGDAGSMFIGFALAVVGLHGSLKATAATVLFLPIIVLGIPIFDTLFAIFRRARGRMSPFKADREHIHHRLVRIGLHHRKVVLVLYFVCAYLALTAYSIAQFPYQTALLFLVLLLMGGIIGLRTLRFIEERLESGYLPAERASGVTDVAPRPSRTRERRARTFGTIGCEVSGFAESFGEASEVAAMREDIRSMLARRIQVHAVVIEPVAPGEVILLVRTEPLKPSLGALVRDGLRWYLEDRRDRYAASAAFPQIRWIPLGSSAPSSEGEGTPVPQIAATGST